MENNELENTFKKRNVSIIFGGSGFIGLHLIKKLLNLDKDSHKVIVIDKYKHPEIDKIKESIVDKNDLQFYQFDMVQDPYSNLEFLNTLYEEDNGNNINIFQLASSLGPENVTKHHSIEDYLLNFNFYSYLVRLMDPNSPTYIKNLKFNKIIFTSTSEVYGDQANMNESEDVRVNILKDRYRPQYALQKLTAENLLLNFGKDFNQNVIVTRLFNIVGPGQKDGFVLSNFNRIFKKNLEIIKTNLELIKDEKSTTEILKPFNIYGDGKQSRTFTDISDTVNAMHLLTIYMDKHEEFNDELNIVNSIINIACVKNEITILKLAYKYLEFYKHIIQGILINETNLNENQKKYLNMLLDDIVTKNNFINFIEPSKDNNINTGVQKRIPTVFKLYKVLGYKPSKNLNNIVNDSLFG